MRTVLTVCPRLADLGRSFRSDCRPNANIAENYFVDNVPLNVTSNPPQPVSSCPRNYLFTFVLRRTVRARCQIEFMPYR